VDEAGRTTRPPLIIAPPSLKADPDGEANDALVDNNTVSRTITATSRSEVDRPANGSNGSSGSRGDSAVAAGTAAEETTETGASTRVPLPADIIGKAKARPSGSSGSDNGQGNGRQGSRQTMTSGEKNTDSAASSPMAEDVAPATKSDRKPSFTPADTGPTPAAAAETASAPTPPAPGTRSVAGPSPHSGSSYSGTDSYSGSSYSGTRAPYSETGYSTPLRYTRSEWSTGPTSTTTPSGSSAAPSASSASAGAAPAGGVGSASRSDYPLSNGFSSGAASAVGGAAAGLASSVTSAWQKRGSTKATQTRKSTKRQAMLTLARVEPWSVMKFSFVASVVAFIVLFVAVAVLYMVLSALGVFDSLQNTVSSITSSQSSSGTNISHWFSASLILGYTAMLGALNIVLITATCTVGSVIYNLIAKTIGGIEVTLRETD
jgi:hypothetical protein